MPSINFNAAAMMNVNRLNKLERGLTLSMERVSSGIRVTRAADDVSAHGVSEYLRGQIRSMHVASRNVQDGIALINVAEGALNEVHDILHRMRELSVQSANGTNTDEDRKYLMMEVSELRKEIDTIARNTHYNGHILLNGKGDWGVGKGGFFQMGPNNTPHTDNISHRIPTVNAKAMGLDGDNLDISTQEGASEAIDKLKYAVEYVNAARADLGGIANRLEYSWKHGEAVIEDNQAYESLLRDTDIAEEMISITRDQIINQYCTAMLAQANQTPQSILQLFGRS